MGGSLFCSHGGSLAVRYMPWPPTHLTLLSRWTHLQQISTQALAINHYPSSTVRLHTPATPFSHPWFPSFCKRKLTLPTLSFVVCLPHRFYTPFSLQWMGIIKSASPWKRTKAPAKRVRRHNHHAISYTWVRYFPVCLLPPLSPGLQPHPSTRWGQGRHVWQIVRELPKKAGWRDAPLPLRNLAVSNLHGKQEK